MQLDAAYRKKVSLYYAGFNKSGRCFLAFSTASCPSTASSQISKDSWPLKSSQSILRISVLSSATRIRRGSLMVYARYYGATEQ